MSTTTLPPPQANGQQGQQPGQQSLTAAALSGNQTAATITADLWHGISIPIIGVAAEVNMGKTLFGLTIDPTTRVPGVAPRTVCWDGEGSSDSYESSLNFDRRDLGRIMAEWMQKHNKKSYSLEDLFSVWYENLLAIKPGQFDVGFVDTIRDIEAGLVEWVRKRPAEFGCTAAEFNKAASMFLWPAVKTKWKQILFVDCRLRFKTFCFSVHLKNEWKGQKKTENRIPEGLDVLSKLATLYLELDRTPDAKSKTAPRVPSAIVVKERLVKFGESEDDDKPILPPRLPKATPAEIRKYILNPPDYNKLKKDEQLPEHIVTDDDRLAMHVQIAEANRATAEFQSTVELTRMDQMKAAAASAYGANPPPAPAVSAAPASPSAPASPATAEATATAANVHQQPPQSPPPQQQQGPAGSATEPIPPDSAAQIRTLFPQVCTAHYDDFAAIMLTETSNRTTKIDELTSAEADGVLSQLHKLNFAKRDAEAKANLTATSDPDPTVRLATTMILPEQDALIRQLLPLAFDATDTSSGDPFADFAAELAKAGVQKIHELSESRAFGIIVWLKDRAKHRGVNLAECGIDDKTSGGPSVPPQAAASPPTATATATAIPAASDDPALAASPDSPGTFTQDQRERISALAQKANWSHDQQTAWLNKHKCNAFRSLSFNQAAKLEKELQDALESFAGSGSGVPGN